ncbi:MAG: phosphatidylserine/phosphatidylglycerophosphate/cardiolipin synthase family protein [Deltaproteobacteria bacterium]|nr:phosphatidylserine/phosphatidylglycerophosphate/cardiolipin synthase family protein [Deltaproteobacteria bacterium]
MPSAFLLLTDASPLGMAAVDLACALLEVPELRIQVLAQPRTRSGPGRWAAIVDALERAEAWGQELLGIHRGTVEAVLESDVALDVDLVVVDPALPRSASEAPLREQVAVAWPAESTGPIRTVSLPYRVSSHSLLAPLSWFRSHPGDVRTLRSVSLEGGGPVLDAGLAAELLGLSQTVEHAPAAVERGSLAALNGHLQETRTDLVAFATPHGPELWPFLVLLREAAFSCPVLLVPTKAPLLSLRPRLQLTDLVRLEDELVGGAVRVDPLGRLQRVHRETLAIVAEAAVLTHVEVLRGAVHLPAAIDQRVLGVTDAEGDPTLEVQGAGRVLELAGPPIRLFLAGDDPPEPVHGERLWAARFAGGPPPESLQQMRVDGVVDGDALLRSGAPGDLPDASGPAQLERLRRRLVWLGAPLADSDIAPRDASLGERLRVLSGAQEVRADAVALLLDNAEARLSLLRLIDEAERSIWMQTFIFEQDEVGELVSAALLRAAERGVAVMLLVDSVFAGHGALGRTNPLLVGLSEHPGAEVRSARPVEQLADLRRRDHRKLLVIDGRLARISGRNVGAPYYTGFDEVPLSATTPVRQVPWLDAGLDVAGGVVGAIADAFASAWSATGGSDLDVQVAAPSEAGSLRCHLVLHETMQDAFTLDTYRALFECATERITLVNTFPLQFELQQVLLRVLERGVKLRFLVGHPRPAFADGTPFPGESYRQLANQVVHGRLDPLVRAGADVRALTMRWREPWGSDIDPLLPHIHAKLLTVDGRVATMGSANLDIAAAYWDSEALLVVQDEGFCARIDGKLDTLFEGSLPFDPNDEEWQQQAAARKTLSRNWPSWAT